MPAAHEGAPLFQEMLDRQSDIDRTGRAITDDGRRYEYRRLLHFPVERERDKNSRQSLAAATEVDTHHTRDRESRRNDLELVLIFSPEADQIACCKALLIVIPKVVQKVPPMRILTTLPKKPAFQETLC